MTEKKNASPHHKNVSLARKPVFWDSFVMSHISQKLVVCHHRSAEPSTVGLRVHGSNLGYSPFPTLLSRSGCF